MSDGSLSQDEIDALLQGGGMDLSSPEQAAPAGGADLTDEEQQKFLGILNGMLASQSSNLNNLLNDTVKLENPTLDVIEDSTLAEIFSGECVEISLDFQEGLQGKHSYVVDAPFAETLASLMMGMEKVELSEAALSALGEAGNTLGGTSATAFGDKIGQTIMPAPVEVHKVDEGAYSFQPGRVVKVEYRFTVDDKPPTQLVELYDLNTVKQLVSSGGEGVLPEAMNPNPQGSYPGGTPGMAPPQGGYPGGTPGMAPPQGGYPGGMPGMAPPQGGYPGGMSGMGQQMQNIQQVHYPSLHVQKAGGEPGNIGLLMDVYMEMTVELGRTKRLIKDILGMGEGTIVELDKLAGEPVDILVNHKLIAKGEVVVIDENFGVRVTEIVSPVDSIGDLT